MDFELCIGFNIGFNIGLNIGSNIGLGPLASILDFAGVVALQAVVECSRHR